VSICADCWRRPSLLGWELLWRWGFGVPLGVILWLQASRIASRASLDAQSLSDLSFSDPVRAAQQLASTATVLAPLIVPTAFWLVPLLAFAWAVVSGLGRSAVMRRIDPGMRSAPLALILLQLLRIIALIVACASWYWAVRWAAGVTLEDGSPNLVAYSAWVICLSLGMFVLWALLSWTFSIAPLLAMLEGTGVLHSLTRSLHLGRLAGKLIEVNLVLGIVRLALIVLAVVFSAIPLPFEGDMTGAALYLWWAMVTLLYLIASDFFQVARLAAFVQYWRLYHPQGE
jgi:hypothetical protein